MDLEGKNLVDYFERIKNLEVSLYQQNVLYKMLQQQVNAILDVPEPELEPAKQGEYEFGIMLLIWICCGVVGFVIPANIFLGHTMLSILGIGVGALVGWLIVKNMMDNEDKRVRARNAIINENNSIIIKEHNEKMRVQKEKAGIVQREMQSLQVTYNETYRLLQTMYNLDVIYPKYRGLIPICSFYEYLVSGRCTTLEGYEGAYNIYENEIRMNMILTKLDDIINRLDVIAQNQRMLYSEINEGNRISQAIANSLSVTAQKLENIENNMDVVNYNVGMINRNTQYITWLKTYGIDFQRSI